MKLKRFKKILKWSLLTLLFIIISLYIFIQTPFGQNWIGRQVTKRLSRDLQTKVTIQHVSFSLLNKMHLEGILIEDRDHDTLLYAGSMDVRITDWFILKKQAELKYVGLTDAVIKFQRTDSVWRQQFIFDYFASPATGDTAKKKAGIRFNLKEVHFKNVWFIKKDGWRGEDMSVHVAGLDMNANDISLSGSIYDINTLNIDQPVFSIRNYTGKRPKKQASPSLSIDSLLEEAHSSVSWNRGGLEIKIANLKIVNGTFKTDKETNRDPYTYFDGQHILFTDINVDMGNAGFVGDTIYTKLKLSAKERSGIEIKEMTADMKFMPTGMVFNNLDLQTNHSRIRNFYSMTYDDMSDMGDYIHKVKMAAVFNDTYIDSDDIAFFAPGMKTWKKEITLQGKVRGTVSDLVGREMIVRAGTSTVLNGDITLTGLPDINQTFIDLKANDFKTTYTDAVTIVPNLRRITTPDLRKIQYVNFAGSFTGFVRDFVTYGTIRTNLGTVKSDLNMKLPRGQQPVYSGNIESDNFNLGQFLGDDKIGSVSLKGTVKGTGFTEKYRNTTFDGVIRFVDYNNYRYQNIAVKGRLDKNLFEGTASIRDDNAEVDLNGVIDFNSSEPRFDLVADVTKANLKALNLTREDYAFKGHFDLDFTTGEVDNFLGDARITGAEFTKNGRLLPFDSLIVRSAYSDTGKTLTAVSNEFNLKLTGNYKIAELPNAFAFVLNKYYPSYIDRPAKYPSINQDIGFDITTYYVDDYLQLIDSSFSGFNNSHITGRLNLANHELNFNAQVPQFRYRQYNFGDLNLTATGTGTNLRIDGKVHNITFTGNDSIAIPFADFTIDARNDSSKIHLVTQANKTLDSANLNALVLTYDDGVKIEFDPSSFTLNGKTWTIDQDGELAFRRNTPVSGQLKLSEGEQKITLRTQPSDTGNWNDLKAELVKINLGDIAPFFLPKNRLEGLVSGNVLIEDPTGRMHIVSEDIQTEFLRLDNDSLGQVKARVEYDGETKQLIVKGSTLNEVNYLGFDMNVRLGEKTDGNNNLIALKAREFNIGVLQRFLGTLFTDIHGYLTGDIDIRDPFNNLSVVGKGRLKNAGLKVIFTQVEYDIRDTDIELTPTEINLDGIILTDKATGNPVYIVGGIEHESFKNMFYNLDITTRKPGTTDDANNRPVQLIRTSYKDNKQFYGDVKGTGSLSLLGPQANMYMKIDAVASDKDSSSVTIPPASSRVSGNADFLVEKKYGREMTEEDFGLSATNIVYDVDVTANPMVHVKVQLDELTGDEIKGRGSGTLNIRSGTAEPLSLRGRFDIEEGDYLFTFQSFFKKPFMLRKGAENFIEWNGDPNQANIKFEAIYTAEKVNFAQLANQLGISADLSQARDDVYVVARLSDQLFKPTINFSLDFPSTSPAKTDPELALTFSQIQKDPNQINTQVAYLVVFNSFAPIELGSGTPGGSSLGINTISSILLNVISDQINKFFGNLLKSDKYDIRVNTSLYNRNLVDPNSNIDLGTNVSFTIGRSFFNNRFIISTGVGLDAPLQETNIQQGIQFLPDVTMEWLINPSGTLRAIFFYRQNADYLTTLAGGPGKATRYGGSFAYRKDVDRLSDLLKKRSKPAKPPKTPSPAVPAEK